MRVALNSRAFASPPASLRPPRALPGGRRSAAYIPFMEHKRPLESISDDELLRRLTELMRQSRRVEADLVAHIGEVDERRLYAREASPSMFAYCTEVLHLSEAEAYLRIAVARASREHPMLLTMLGDGRLHLTGIVRLAPHLTRENRDALLERATHRSKRQIEELIAEIAPRPDVPAVMRKLPERRHAAHARAPTRAGGPCQPWSPDGGAGHSVRTVRLSGPCARRRPRSSSPWRLPDTRCSSRPAPSSATSWSASGP